MIRLFSVLFFAGCFFSAFSQSQFFERPLDPGRLSLGLDVIPSDRDEYLFSNLLPTPGPIPGGNINLTRLKPAGQIVWSKDFFFNTQLSSGKLTPWPGEQAYALSGLAAGPDTVVHGYLSKIQSFTGDVIWSKKIPLNGAVHYSNMGKAQALTLPGDTIALGMGAASFDNIIWKNDLCLAQLDSAGNFLWGTNYCFSCNGLFEIAMGNIIPTSDGGFLFSGSLQRPDNTVLRSEIFLMKVDAEGGFLWGKGYDLSDTLSFLLNRGLEAAELPNGHFVAVGQSRDVLDNSQRGVILETDAEGEFVRALRVSLPSLTPQSIFFKHLAALDSNTIVVHGTAVDSFMAPPAVERNFLFQIQLESGDIDWQTQFVVENLSDGLSSFDGFSTLGGGYAILANYVEFPQEAYPYLIVADLDGRTGCHTPISLQVQDSLVATVNNYAPEVLALDAALDFPATQQDFADYTIDVPVLDLGDSEFFCEPTTIPLDAFVEGAESYAWNNGATTPQILAEVPGIYTVEDTSMVRCWILRDTIAFNILPPPFVSIAADTTGYCEFGQATLTAGAVGAETLSWNTGETSSTIVVTAAGTYSVIATNICGTTTASFNLVLPNCTGEPKECRLEFPNIFSPDNDGINDRFKPLSDCEIYAEYHFRIYSRWGELVFESKDPTQSWNGEYKAKALPSDLFAWILEYRFPEQEESKMEKGEVTLMR